MLHRRSRSTRRAGTLARALCWFAGLGVAGCAGMRQAAAEQPPALGAAAGKSLYARYCQLCHGADATGYAADHAPSLVSATFLASATDEFIASGIRFGRPGTAMGAYGKALGGPLADEQIGELVAFLRSKGPRAAPLAALKLEGDAARGEALYARECRSCHGDGQTPGTAPSLQNPEFLAAAPPAFVRHAIVHGRPPTRMPAFARRLTPAQIDDLVVWLESLRPAQPLAHRAAPAMPDQLPLVIHPQGKAPEFALRDGRFVPAAQVKQALATGQRLIIIDARSPSDWLQFHIPGAISVPYYETAKLTRIPNDGTWVVAYCACPHHASGAIVDALRRMGYPHTAVLDEGILFWRRSGYALEGAAVKP